MTDDKDEWFNLGTAKVNGEIDISCDTLYILIKFDWQHTDVADMSLVPFWCLY